MAGQTLGNMPCFHVLTCEIEPGPGDFLKLRCLLRLRFMLGNLVNPRRACTLG